MKLLKWESRYQLIPSKKFEFWDVKHHVCSSSHVSCKSKKCKWSSKFDSSIVIAFFIIIFIIIVLIGSIWIRSTCDSFSCIIWCAFVSIVFTEFSFFSCVWVGIVDAEGTILTLFISACSLGVSYCNNCKKFVKHSFWNFKFNYNLYLSSILFILILHVDIPTYFAKFILFKYMIIFYFIDVSNIYNNFRRYL